MAGRLHRDEQAREQRMREHSRRHGKDEEQDLNTREPGDAFKERNYQRDASDLDSGDPDQARLEGDIAHVTKTALPPGITPGDLFDPGSQPTELASDEHSQEKTKKART
ncbi:MAG TPA: hypothetical protein VMV45_13500 [Casimicrobiaceae bacterium]|nr:hypothetical protein [Casimicrobiaceae bacterium]